MKCNWNARPNQNGMGYWKKDNNSVVECKNEAIVIHRLGRIQFGYCKKHNKEGTKALIKLKGWDR